MKKLFILLIGLAFLCGLKAQKSLIQGQILDAIEQDAAAFALVKINDNYTYADEKGYFQITLSPSSTYHLEVSQLGYETLFLELPAGQTEQLLIKLNPKSLLLEEIIVSEQPMHCSPQCNIVCDRAKQSSQPRDVGDLFKEIPGFSVIKKGGFAMDPVFRAFKYEQLNIIYDGGIQIAHACPARMDPASTHVNPDQVQKIELIKGPFSVRYGAAMGATINIVTETWNPHKEGISGYVSGAYETNGNAKLTQFQIQRNEMLDILLSGGWKSFGNYQSGDGTEIPSSFEAYDYSFKAGYDIGKNQRLQLNWRQAITRDVLHAGLAMDTDSDDSYFLSLDYQWKNISPKLYGLSSKVYGNRVDHIMSNHRRPNVMMVDAVSDVSAANYGIRTEATLMPGEKNLIYVGFDYHYLWRDGYRTRMVKHNMMTGEHLPEPKIFEDPIWQNADIQDVGLFVEARHFINPKWTLSVGLRSDFVQTRAQSPAPDFEALYGEVAPADECNISGNASINWHTDKDWNLQLAIGRGLRTANMIERYINHFTVGMDPYEYVGNPNLKPERNQQVEFSIAQKKERYEFGVNIFYSHLSHFITAAVDSTLAAKYMGGLPHARRFVNIENATQAGFECSAALELLKNLTLTGSLSFTRAQNLDWDEPLAEIPPFEGFAGLRYERKKLWLDARARFAGAQNRVSETFGESSTPGFSVYDFRAGFEPLKGLNFGFAVLNVLDRQFREHLNRAYRNMPEQSIIFEPGRNLTLFLKYSF